MESTIRTHTPAYWLPLVFASALAAGCSTTQDSEAPAQLPDDSDTNQEDDTGPFEFPIDTSEEPELNEQPQHWLHSYQTGTWNLAPAGGPYISLTGKMDVLEFIDFTLPTQDDTDLPLDTGPPWDTDPEETPLLCKVTYNLTGEPSEAPCTGCSFTMEVSFYVIDGDPSECRDPDLPADAEVRRMGFNPTKSALLYDYYDTGVWFPWYPAELVGSAVQFAYVDKKGLSIEEEDDD